MTNLTQKLLGLEGASPDLTELYEDITPVLYKRNCLYIVSAVLIEDDKVLLVREAKEDCYGKLYLPAGKVKKNEPLEAAFERELEEESCIKGKADHLVSTNCLPNWFRFNFIGHKIGGHLKTTAEKDKESLDAGWYSIKELIEKRLDLRCGDIIQIVNDAVFWLNAEKVISHERTLPLPIGHSYLLQRLFIVDRHEIDNIKVLVRQKDQIFPIQAFWFIRDNQIKYIFKDQSDAIQVLGLISVEHRPSETDNGNTDGLCMNFLCEVIEGNVLSKVDGYEWIAAGSDVNQLIKEVVNSNSYIVME